MIFQHTINQVLDKSKTQTRRLCKPNERLLRNHKNQPWVDMAFDGHDRRKWYIGQTLAVQPGHGQKAVGRIRITDIRRERVHDMPWQDVEREIPHLRHTVARGALSATPPDPRWKFVQLWDTIHTKPGTRWQDNPPVWVLDFELVEPSS